MAQKFEIGILIPSNLGPQVEGSNPDQSEHGLLFSMGRYQCPNRVNKYKEIYRPERSLVEPPLRTFALY